MDLIQVVFHFSATIFRTCAGLKMHNRCGVASNAYVSAYRVIGSAGLGIRELHRLYL